MTALFDHVKYHVELDPTLCVGLGLMLDVCVTPGGADARQRYRQHAQGRGITRQSGLEVNLRLFPVGRQIEIRYERAGLVHHPGTSHARDTVSADRPFRLARSIGSTRSFGSALAIDGGHQIPHAALCHQTLRIDEPLHRFPVVPNAVAALIGHVQLTRLPDGIKQYRQIRNLFGRAAPTGDIHINALARVLRIAPGHRRERRQ